MKNKSKSSTGKLQSKRGTCEEKDETERLASTEVTPRAKRPKKNQPPEIEPKAEVEPEVKEEKIEYDFEEGEEKSDDPSEEVSAELKSVADDESEKVGYDSDGRSVIEVNGVKKFRREADRLFDATKFWCPGWMSQNDVMSTLAERLE
jgi:hypothetical protein